MWLPLMTEPLIAGATSRLENPGLAWLDLIGRVRPGTNPRTLEAQLQGELRQWLADTLPTLPAAFASRPVILPPYVHRSKSIEMLLPILYLKGISTGDFSLAALLGKDVAGLSPTAIQGGMDRRARRMAETRSVSETLRVRLGRWHSP